MQGLLGDKNSKARFIDNMMQALDAMNDPRAHDFVINLSDPSTPTRTHQCVICGADEEFHEDRLGLPDLTSEEESRPESRVSISDAET